MTFEEYVLLCDETSGVNAKLSVAYIVAHESKSRKSTYYNYLLVQYNDINDTLEWFVSDSDLKINFCFFRSCAPVVRKSRDNGVVARVVAQRRLCDVYGPSSHSRLVSELECLGTLLGQILRQVRLKYCLLE